MKTLVVIVTSFMKSSRGVTERLLQAVEPADSFKGEEGGMTREGRDSESTGGLWAQERKGCWCFKTE